MQLNNYYNISDIGVWPKQESTSQLDALSAGLPIVITNESGVVERSFDSGLTYENNSANNMAKQIIKILNKDLYLKFSKNAIKKSYKKYSWGIIAKEYEIDYLNYLKE